MVYNALEILNSDHTIMYMLINTLDVKESAGIILG